jgi:hypothetical protein
VELTIAWVTRPGLSFGYADLISAATPATKADAGLVPLPDR